MQDLKSWAWLLRSDFHESVLGAMITTILGCVVVSVVEESVLLGAPQMSHEAFCETLQHFPMSSIPATRYVASCRSWDVRVKTEDGDEESRRQMGERSFLPKKFHDACHSCLRATCTVAVTTMPMVLQPWFPNRGWRVRTKRKLN